MRIDITETKVAGPGCSQPFFFNKLLLEAGAEIGGLVLKWLWPRAEILFECGASAQTQEQDWRPSTFLWLFSMIPPPLLGILDKAGLFAGG
jgi:hypothetical protein